MVILQKTVDSPWPDSQKKIRFNIELVVSKIQKIHQFEISLLLLDDKEMREINRIRRGKDKPTDVLSFPIAESIPFGLPNLGEIYISWDTLQRQALEIGHSRKEEFYRLLVHGILHLLGYDHEISEKEEKRMKKKEDECLALIFSS